MPTTPAAWPPESASLLFHGRGTDHAHCLCLAFCSDARWRRIATATLSALALASLLLLMPASGAYAAVKGAAAPLARLEEVALAPVKEDASEPLANAMFSSFGSNLSSTSTARVTFGPLLDWVVSYEGSVEVYKWESVEAQVSYSKWKCSIFKGRQHGNWVHLEGETGFVQLRKDDSTAVRPIPVYRKLAEGTCEDVGMHPVRDKYTCETAARAMGLGDVTAQRILLVPLPEGCHLFGGQLSTGLYLSTNHLNAGNGALHSRQPICSTYQEPVQPCLPATTTVTSTTTWGWPSLFCASIAHGREELSLLQQQLQMRSGIFGCDGVAVYSTRTAARLGDWAGMGLNAEALSVDAGGQLGNTSFMEMWRAIRLDGRYRRHDWCVTASPFTLFFPERLRGHLIGHTPAGGSSLFLRGCKPLYGQFQVRSRGALEAYFWNEKKCREQLDWLGWDEEHFLEECLKWLQVGSVYDGAVAACGATNCWDRSKVVYHGFKGEDRYLTCWRRAKG